MCTIIIFSPFYIFIYNINASINISINNTQTNVTLITNIINIVIEIKDEMPNVKYDIYVGLLITSNIKVYRALVIKIPLND